MGDMFESTMLSRRSLLALAAGAPALKAAKFKKIPIGLELYSCRGEMKKDDVAVVKAVGKMGYDGVEFYGPYLDWTVEKAKEMRKVLDESGLKCFSAHTGRVGFEGKLDHAIELNSILGSKFVVMSSAGKVEGLDGWKGVAETLNKANEKMKKAKLAPGFHNHQTEFKPLDGTKPLELLAKNTVKDVVLQLDVGTCVETGNDPVAWINANAGRIKSVHCKEYSKDPAKKYRVLFGEGDSPWKEIFAAAESKGGVQHYLIEQEGSAMSEMETVAKCLELIKKMRA
jgi:sugar phosphate isomerase/epimerase